MTHLSRCLETVLEALRALRLGVSVGQLLGGTKAGWSWDRLCYGVCVVHPRAPRCFRAGTGLFKVDRSLKHSRNRSSGGRLGIGNLLEQAWMVMGTLRSGCLP